MERANAAPERWIKVKSLATDEIGLERGTRGAGIRAVETDLAELIVQLADDRPSHILVPAIHRNRAEIRELFQRTIAARRAASRGARRLAETARRYLRGASSSARRWQ